MFKLIFLLFSILFFSCDDSDSSSNPYYGIVECQEPNTVECQENCSDDNTTTSALGGCDAAIAALGCDFVYANTPLYELCPVACDTCLECCFDDNATTSALGGCDAAIAALGCDFVYANTPLHELCPETCLACDEEPYSSYTFNTCYSGILSGRVVDSGNNPLANYGVILGHKYLFGVANVGEAEALQGGIHSYPDCDTYTGFSGSFNIVIPYEDGSTITFTIESICGDFIKTIYDGFLDQNWEGHSITFDGTDNDGKLLKPGGYIIKVITSFGDSSQNILNLVYTGNQSCLDFNTDYNMHAMTDEFGNFNIDIACEPFGLTFPRTTSDGLYLDDYEIPFEATFNIYNSLGHVYSTDFINIESGHIDLVVP